MGREREDHEDRAPRPASVLAGSSLFAEPSVLAAGSVLLAGDAERPARGSSLLRPADDPGPAGPPAVPSAARVAERLATALEPVLDADLVDVARRADAPAVRVPDLVAASVATPPGPSSSPRASTGSTAGLPGGEELSPRLRQALRQARAGRAEGTWNAPPASRDPAAPAGNDAGRIVVAILLTFFSGGLGAAVAGFVLLGGRPSPARRAFAWLLVVLGALWLLALVLAAAD